MQDKNATDFFAAWDYTESKGGVYMQVYLDLVLLLNFGVDFLLLLGTNRLSGYPARVGRAAISASLGALYACICLVPQFSFLGNFLWRTVALAFMAVVAFGISRSALRRGILFLLLSMALGGVASGVGAPDFGILLLAAMGILLLSVISLPKGLGVTYIPVELIRGEKRVVLTALRDTGNTLTDPVTGEQILVAGADVAWDVLGLTPGQLADPVGTMQHSGISGLRLVPYHSVGNPGGLLLAARFDDVKVGGVSRGHLVAFTAERIGKSEGYQALAGGSC